MITNKTLNFMMIFKLFEKIILIFAILFSLTSCQALKYKPVDAKEFPPEPEKRVKKNIEEGRAFRLFGDNEKKGGTFDFASSNPLWQSTLEVIDFMPLVSANYSGGIVVTDWYSENNTPNESVKISVRFLTNEIRSDALDINIFLKKCSENLTNCSISKNNTDLVADLNLNILKKATKYQKQKIEKYKKENPYVISDGDINRKSREEKKK